MSFVTRRSTNAPVAGACSSRYSSVVSSRKPAAGVRGGQRSAGTCSGTPDTEYAHDHPAHVPPIGAIEGSVGAVLAAAGRKHGANVRIKPNGILQAKKLARKAILSVAAPRESTMYQVLHFVSISRVHTRTMGPSWDESPSRPRCVERNKRCERSFESCRSRSMRMILSCRRSHASGARSTAMLAQ